MAFGRPAERSRPTPLLDPSSLLAAMCNLGPALITDPIRAELIVVARRPRAVRPAACCARAAVAGSSAPIDLERFQRLKQPQ